MTARDQDGSRDGRPGAPRTGGGGREARRVERREAILESAMELIAERGYRRTTLAAVAERAGLTQQGLLHHFPTKELLLVSVLEARDRWDLASAAAASGSRTDTLAALVDYNATRPGIVRTYTVLSADSVTEGHPARAFFESRFRSVRASLADALRAECGDTLPGGLTPEQAAPLMVAVLDGLQLQWLLDPQEVDMPSAFRDFLALLGRGEEESGGRGGGADGAGGEGADGVGGGAASG
ncbi:TetR/AcrR family transcriptional regulator [Streptomyces kronopolitis]|uniref:TetR/AcrR family transcriptional regulator n=1 Tax=Streptomyces kronopolitis TaxID=1612435 RepID=UPI0036958DDF